MKGEINKDYFCAAHRDPNACHGFDNMYTDGCFKRSKYSSRRQSKNTLHCEDCHRKHPTPEQFKEEYGEEYPDDSPVYVDYTDKYGVKYNWNIDTFGRAKGYLENKENKNFFIICVCTPFGKPDEKWRPE